MRAERGLAYIQTLYLIERELKGKSSEEILSIRTKDSYPLLLKCKEWMIRTYPEVLPKSLLGAAISYSLPRWDKLARYTEDGRLKIDNNPVENGIRPVEIGRKNYLFAGSREGARRAVLFYSLLGT